MFRFVIFSCLFLAVFAASSSRPKPSQGRIVGGHDTDITVVPHQVSVQFKNEHICGGSIIGAKYILTAAHCFVGQDGGLFSIRAGSSYYNTGGQVVDVAKVITHSKFDGKIGNYDAAILVLNETLTDDVGVKIATLANVEPRVGEMVLISGWGSVQENKDFSVFLQAVHLPVVSKKSCQERYKWYTNVTDQMFCAGFINGRMDTCHGDSGGPGMVNGRLAGIISWGDGCAHPNSPSIFVNVASILTWIAENTNL